MKLIKAEEMKRDSYFNIMIYAKPGGGKTSTAKLLKGKTLLLDIDGTSQVLSGTPGIDVAKVDEKDVEKSLGEFYLYASEHIEEYDNLFIDNLSAYQRLWFANKSERTKSGMAELKHYQVFDLHILRIVSAFNTLPINTVYTLWENTREITTESGQVFNQFFPDVRLKIVNDLMGITPVVARLVTNPETGNKGFILKESNGVYAKNQLDGREFCTYEEIFDICTN